MSVARYCSLVGVNQLRSARFAQAVNVQRPAVAVYQSCRPSFRAYSTDSDPSLKVSDVSGQEYVSCEEMDYDDVMQGLQADNSRIYIDVRETDEVAETGQIPTSRTLPLSEFADAFSLSDSEYEARFGFKKPAKNTNIVLYCRSGRRSKSACKILRDMGYGNVKNYTGSWMDWSSKSSQ